MAYANTDPAGTPFSDELTSTWIVPLNRARCAGQTLYFFPGLVKAPPGELTILQQVPG